MGVNEKNELPLASHGPDQIPPDSGYDADLLIPHWDAQTERWGYLQRKTKEVVVPHQFTEAGKFAMGYALAIAPQIGKPGFEDFYRVTTHGVQLLFSDTKMPDQKGLVERGRMRDNWIVMDSHDRVVCIDPEGKLRLDTVIQDAAKRFCYLQQGRYYLIEDQICSFIQFGKGRLASWNMAQYDLMICPLHPNGESPLDPYFWVRNKRSLKVGIVDATGRLVVPLEWEMPQGSYSRNGLEQGTQLYNPCIDGFYLGYKDAQFSLMHLDGRVVQAYNEQLRPTARDHLPWRIAGQLYAWYLNDQGLAKIALGTPDDPSLISCDNCGLLPLDSTHIFNTWWTGHAVVDTETGEEKELDALKTYSQFAAQTAITSGNRVVYVVAAGAAFQVGAINDLGEIVVPFQYAKVEVHGNYPNRYPMLLCTQNDGNRSTYAYYSAAGNLLFGGKFYLTARPEGGPGELVGFGPAPDDHFKHCGAYEGLAHHLDTVHPFFPEGEFPPNLLLYVEQFVQGKGVMKGYVDVYGERYF